MWNGDRSRCRRIRNNAQHIQTHTKCVRTCMGCRAYGMGYAGLLSCALTTNRMSTTSSCTKCGLSLVMGMQVVDSRANLLLRLYAHRAPCLFSGFEQESQAGTTGAQERQLRTFVTCSTGEGGAICMNGKQRGGNWYEEGATPGTSVSQRSPEASLTLPQAELAYQALSRQICFNAGGQGKEYFSNSNSFTDYGVNTSLRTCTSKRSLVDFPLKMTHQACEARLTFDNATSYQKRNTCQKQGSADGSCMHRSWLPVCRSTSSFEDGHTCQRPVRTE